MFTAFLTSILSGILFWILRVSGGSSFPKPLSAAEEQDCLQKMKAGDASARNRLISHNLRLVAHIVKKYYTGSAEQDDLISIGTIGLIKAANTFNEKKGIRFSSYAARCIENEILMFFRSSRKSTQDLSLNEPIDTDKDGNILTIMDIIAEEDTICDDLNTRIQSEKLIRFMKESLTFREKELLSMRYGLIDDKPLTQREIAAKMGISRSYVSRIEKKALGKLRKRFMQSG